MSTIHSLGIDSGSTNSISRRSAIAGNILVGYIALFMGMDAAMHLAKPAMVVDSFNKIGMPIGVSVPLGIVTLICTILYVYPRTAVLGAILLTGYLGGATAIQVRVEGSFVFSVVTGVMVWGGLYLRDQRIRDLIPLQVTGK